MALDQTNDSLKDILKEKAIVISFMKNQLTMHKLISMKYFIKLNNSITNRNLYFQQIENLKNEA